MATLVLEDERDVHKVKFEAAEFHGLSPFRHHDKISEEVLTPRMYSLK